MSWACAAAWLDRPSQRELAARSGVSNATISRIEKGRLSPTVATRFNRWSALPLSIAGFWDLELSAPEQVFYRFEALTRIRHNPVTRGRRLARRRHGLAIRTLRARHGWARGTKEDADVAGFIIDRQLEVTIGEQSRVLKAGGA